MSPPQLPLIFRMSSDDVYISINFQEHILNGFQLIQRKQNYYCQTSKENNSKNIHYENTPIQIYRKFHLQKLKIFR